MSKAMHIERHDQRSIFLCIIKANYTVTHQVTKQLVIARWSNSILAPLDVGIFHC